MKKMSLSPMKPSWSRVPSLHTARTVPNMPLVTPPPNLHFGACAPPWPSIRRPNTRIHLWSGSQSGDGGLAAASILRNGEGRGSDRENTTKPQSKALTGSRPAKRPPTRRRRAALNGRTRSCSALSQLTGVNDSATLVTCVTRRRVDGWPGGEGSPFTTTSQSANNPRVGMTQFHPPPPITALPSFRDPNTWSGADSN